MRQELKKSKDKYCKWGHSHAEWMILQPNGRRRCKLCQMIIRLRNSGNLDPSTKIQRISEKLKGKSRSEYAPGGICIRPANEIIEIGSHAAWMREYGIKKPFLSRFQYDHECERVYD